MTYWLYVELLGEKTNRQLLLLHAQWLFNLAFTEEKIKILRFKIKRRA